MEFCHIAPTNYIDLVADHPRHLLLAHLVESDPQYVNQYLKIKQANPNATFIMDNSAFEMFKQNKPMFDSEKLIRLAKKCHADYIVLSDYPGERWQKTYEKGIEMAEEVHRAGFMTFYVPQSNLGDLDGYMAGLINAIVDDRHFDLIGLSILGCPIALGLSENRYGEVRDGAYKLQRYLSRYRIFEILEQRVDQMSLEDRTTVFNRMIKRFHCLGMVEGPREISLLEKYHNYIASWDSSSAIWHGLNNIRYDDSPTGLINGKFEKEVDFNFSRDYSRDNKVAIEIAEDNIKFIDKLY